MQLSHAWVEVVAALLEPFFASLVEFHDQTKRYVLMEKQTVRTWVLLLPQEKRHERSALTLEVPLAHHWCTNDRMPLHKVYSILVCTYYS